MANGSIEVELSDGAKLHVWLLGAENKDKPLIIALHGAPGLDSHIESEGSLKFLATKYRVLVYDARGSGESDVKGPFTDEQWIADLDEISDARRAWSGEEKFILAGYSYGGFLALGYALAFPHRLSGFILRNTWPCGPRGTHRALAGLLASPRINPDPIRQARLWSGTARDQEDIQKGLAEILPAYVPERKEGEPEPEPITLGSGLRWEVHNAAFSYSQPRFDVRHRLGEIKTPTLVTVGRQDLVCPLEDAEEISRGIPNSELVIFDKSWHNPAADEPEKFQKVVFGYLEKLGF
ncbi:Proline iminopeptidase [Fusarium albosuccineum]|uniref:Proline iminopeptidase n=1 Tax=Fusarium albosuccineum TaxID=1237068 RepID=A0A8H4L4J7_9HYPO|nr:Proline iminopeptidase [Fusarium albosuccineum]